jgi:thioredoxin 1
VKNNHLLQTILKQAVIALFLVFFSGIVMAQAPPLAKAAPAKSLANKADTSQSLPLLVDVGADKCIPCIKMAPILEDLKKEYEGILEVKFIDVWKKPEEANKYRVRGIPTQIFYDPSGKELGRHMGFIDKEGILEGFKHFDIILRTPVKK